MTLDQIWQAQIADFCRCVRRAFHHRQPYIVQGVHVWPVGRLRAGKRIKRAANGRRRR